MDVKKLEAVIAKAKAQNDDEEPEMPPWDWLKEDLVREAYCEGFRDGCANMEGDEEDARRKKTDGGPAVYSLSVDAWRAGWRAASIEVFDWCIAHPNAYEMRAEKHRRFSPIVDECACPTCGRLSDGGA